MTKLLKDDPIWIGLCREYQAAKYSLEAGDRAASKRIGSLLKSMRDFMDGWPSWDDPERKEIALAGFDVMIREWNEIDPPRH